MGKLQAAKFQGGRKKLGGITAGGVTAEANDYTFCALLKVIKAIQTWLYSNAMGIISQTKSIRSFLLIIQS